MTWTGIRVPSIAIDVKVAKIPPAGVKAPYMHDWKAAARVPVSLLLSVSIKRQNIIGGAMALSNCENIPAPMPGALNPTSDSRMRTTVKVIDHARISASTSEMLISIRTWVEMAAEVLTRLLEPFDEFMALSRKPSPYLR